ncbi:clavesin-2-like [Uloborus diversus]|uniref:clavesin-2-like n=1 Tax=Uloborus diversus TaxID=327109 RepID=UPI002409E3C8|nr:clavesin-2-like [Uloborus diversus]XP_054718833.1 clavesin-2-like [Uloborus diversus]XP_054718834.1 clavesin-2-like [Uloborus diversus]
MPTEMITRYPENNKVEALPYELNYMTDELRKRAKTELFEDEDTRVHSLRLLRSMLKEEKDLHFQDEELFLLAFLRARKFDVKRAFNLMKTFYTVMNKHDELYHNFNFEDVRTTIRETKIGFLPYRDSEGCCILIISTVDWDPCRNPLGDVMRALTSGLLHAIRSPSTQVAGFKVIVDFAGVTLRHVPHISPTYLWLFAEALQNCFPSRFRAVHMVNEGHLFSYTWAVLKQLLTKKLRERFHFHGKNVKKLHKYFSPSILPAEYCGDLPPFDTSEWLEKMEASSNYITHAYSFGYKKHNKKSKNHS